MPGAVKITSLIGQQIGLGIGAAAALLDWTASLVRFRNKAGTNFVGVEAQTVAVYNPAGTFKATIGLPAAAAANTLLTLPATAGTAGQVLQTNGAGLTDWASAGTTADSVKCDTTTLAFGTASPLTMFTLPANAVVVDTQVIVDTPFTGTPTVSVGVAGTLSKYAGAPDSDLLVVNTYDLGPSGLPAAGATESVIATYSAGGASAGSARLLVFYTIPS